MENKVKLKQEHIDLLSNLPESGMGYQIADITLKDGTVLVERIILNSSYLKLNDSEVLIPEEILKIRLHR